MSVLVMSCGASCRCMFVSSAQGTGCGSSGASLVSRGLAAGPGRRQPVDSTPRRLHEQPSCSERVSAFGPEICPIVEKAKVHAILTRRDPAPAQCDASLPAAGDDRLAPYWTTQARLRGLAVLNIVPTDQGRTRTGKIVDCLLDDIDVEHWQAAMLALTRELARQGADLAQAYASTPWTVEALRRSGYQSRFAVKFHIRDRQGIDPTRGDISPHAAGGRLCLYIGCESGKSYRFSPVFKDRPAMAEVFGLVTCVFRVAKVDQVEVDAFDIGPT